MAKPDFTTQDATTYKTNIDTEVGYLYDTGLVSATGDPILKKVDATGTVVNYLEVENAVTGSPPIVRAAGTDTNIDLQLAGKGAGSVYGTLNEQPTHTVNTSTNADTFITSVPSWVKRITLLFDEINESPTNSVFNIRIGPSSGVATSGYVSPGVYHTDAATAINVVSESNRFRISLRDVGASVNGVGILTKKPSENTWFWECKAGAFANGTADRFAVFSGYITLSGALAQVQLENGGSSNFTGGSIGIIYEG